MSRTVLVIRHAISEGGRHDRHLFPKEGAPLSAQGILDAQGLHAQLVAHNVDLENEPVAISELIRTRQTAEHAGLKNLSEYAMLNEVDSGLSPEELDAIIENKQVPKKAIAAAQKLLTNPPKESIWVTHGMLIAAMARELRIPPNELFVPDMATITALQI